MEYSFPTLLQVLFAKTEKMSICHKLGIVLINSVVAMRLGWIIPPTREISINTWRRTLSGCHQSESAQKFPKEAESYIEKVLFSLYMRIMTIRNHLKREKISAP